MHSGVFCEIVEPRGLKSLISKALRSINLKTFALKQSWLLTESPGGKLQDEKVKTHLSRNLKWPSLQNRAITTAAESSTKC